MVIWIWGIAWNNRWQVNSYENRSVYIHILYFCYILCAQFVCTSWPYKLTKTCGLLPDRTKPLHEPMLSNRQWVLVVSTEGSFTRNTQDIYHWYVFENFSCKITAASARGQWVVNISNLSNYYSISSLFTRTIIHSNSWLWSFALILDCPNEFDCKNVLNLLVYVSVYLYLLSFTDTLVRWC